MYFAEKHPEGGVSVWAIRDEKAHVHDFMRFHLERPDMAAMPLSDFITAATARNATFRAFKTGVDLAAALLAGDVPGDLAPTLSTTLTRHERVAKRPFDTLRLCLALLLLSAPAAHADDLRADYIGKALASYAEFNTRGRIETGQLRPAPGYVRAASTICELTDGRKLVLSFLSNDEGEDLARITAAARDGAALRRVVVTMTAGEGRDAYGVTVLPRECSLFLRDGSPVVVEQ